MLLVEYKEERYALSKAENILFRQYDNPAFKNMQELNTVKHYFDSLGYIKGSYEFNCCDTSYIRIRKEIIREATTEEVMAYHIIEAYCMWNIDPTMLCQNCVYVEDGRCSFSKIESMAKEILRGKEMIVDRAEM